MKEERLKEIIREFYGDLKLAVPDEELKETIQDLKLTKEEITELGIESALEFINPCDGCKNDGELCFHCIHGYYGSGKKEFVGGRELSDWSWYR